MERGCVEGREKERITCIKSCMPVDFDYFNNKRMGLYFITAGNVKKAPLIVLTE